MVQYMDIDICTIDTVSSFLLSSLLYVFFFLSLSNSQAQLSCTTFILTRAGIWVEQALSSICLLYSLQNKNSSHGHLDIIHWSGASPLRLPFSPKPQIHRGDTERLVRRNSWLRHGERIRQEFRLSDAVNHTVMRITEQCTESASLRCTFFRSRA